MTDDPLWGKQTDLAIRNFPVARRPLHTHVAKSLAAVKRHAASVNASLGVSGVDEELAAAIADAAQRVEAGELDDHFPVDVFQTGSGTSTNMNVNEVLARLVGDTLEGRDVHPNDHINASQSSNDTVPTAVRLAVARQLAEEVHPAVESLARAFRTMADRFRTVVKAGRTHLMKLLEWLARVQLAETKPLFEWLPQATVDLSWGTTVVAVTPSADEAMSGALHRLRRGGLNPVLIAVEPHAQFSLVYERCRKLGIAAYQVADESELRRWQARPGTIATRG
jgi:hypothetical protein